MMDVYDELRKHINQFWPENVKEEQVWKDGAIQIALPNFRVVVISPRTLNDPWIYITLGAWEVTKDEEYDKGKYGLEFLILSPVRDDIHINTLAMVAFYHHDPQYRLMLGDTINLGEGWMGGTCCDHFLVSLPYLYPPEFETVRLGDMYISFWWLLPITQKEVEYLQTHGQEALEKRLERKRINYLDPNRKSAV